MSSTDAAGGFVAAPARNSEAFPSGDFAWVRAAFAMWLSCCRESIESEKYGATGVPDRRREALRMATSLPRPGSETRYR